MGMAGIKYSSRDNCFIVTDKGGNEIARLGGDQAMNVVGALLFSAAKHTDNIKGNPSFEKVVQYDDFLGSALDTTNDWVPSLDGTSDAFAVSAAQGGIGQILSGTGDNEETIINGQLVWSGDKNVCLEVRLRLVDVSGVGVFCGLADAAGEMSMDYKDGTLTTTATDAVGFLMDADKATSSIYCVGVKGNTDTTPADTGTDWADNVWHVLRVETKGDNASFYLDGVHIADVANTQEGGNALCVTISVENRDAAADNVDIDYIKVWQDR